MIADFKTAMRRMASTVSIITCANEAGAHGMTATAVTSVCAEPSSLLVCVNTAASFHHAISGAERFCVNLLDSSQVDLSQAFSGRLKGAERFSVGSWQLHDDGLPYLEDAQANLFCLVDRRIAYGTHTIFIGRVEHVLIADQVSPLLYQDGSYASAHRLAAA
ncbi:flavin reductase family protein [Cupriavidus gilardii]|uniref:Flavin reductase (DIM6/NTAB) family NADH-FMN oxidoreductase RutF n=3 Tax=Pseudomonadota TaxID=1224 RepID=A0A562B2J6_9BURK|nr:flavin reductase family protein [Cupriavidus gilardii]ALD90048.1 flavin reductase-like, FMN-binding [Cupriavidus gilardii CR3]QQE07574.1 flavin reductase family protein [Cupriavidus sp. ISTL7]MCT9015082.1 flavin reductase family protein [Cupriavidus gilardii]MCT9054852.1 flavin reductase family protein [Cupriavidus gilardii]MCT9116087.1 flavin reductase family protein [Cupriavidus gilardii]